MATEAATARQAASGHGARLQGWAKDKAALLALSGVLVVVSVITAVQSDVFLSLPNARNILLQVSVLAIVAAGTTILMVSGGIDLSIGSIMSLAAVSAALLMRDTGWPLILTLIVGILAAGLAGAGNGVLAAFSTSHPFVVTLGTMIFLQGVSIQLTGGIPVSGLSDTFIDFASTSLLGLPQPVWLAGFVAIATGALLRFTTFGRRLYAIGGSEKAATLAGINVRRTKMIAYTISGVLAGIAGLLLASRISSAQPLMGVGFELTAIAAVAIGGTPLAGGRGSMGGTLLGVLLLGVISNSLNLLGVSGAFQLMLQGAIIVAAVMSQRSR